MAIVESPAGLSLPSAILEAAMGLGTLEVAYHETGAIRTAKASSRGGPALVEVIIALLERASTLESLDVSLTEGELEHVWRALLAAPRPSLRWLRIHEEGELAFGKRTAKPRLLSKLERALSALEVLVLEGATSAWSLGHDTLRELRLVGRPLKSLRAMRSPSLERLVWRLPADESGVGSPHACVTPLWKPGALPKLRELDVAGVVLDDAMWDKDMVGSEVLSHLRVLRAPGIDDPKLLLANLDRFKYLERFEVPWIDGRGADELLRTLVTLRVREREESDDPSGVDLSVVGEEGWVLDWRGFTPSTLKNIPDAVRALALHSVFWDDDEAASFGRAAAERFERLRTVGERIPGDALAIGLCQSLATSRLSSLSLARAPVGARTVESLGRALESARSLRALSLILDESATDGAASALARSLPASALEQLSLEGAWLLHESDGSTLGKAVAISPIRAVSLLLADAPPASRGGAGGALASFIANMGQRPYDRLTIVHTEGPGEGAAALPPLSALAWRRARVRGDTSNTLGAAFANILRTQPQLRELDLLESQLTPDDFAELAAAVAEHPALECLRLSHVVLDTESMARLSAAIRSSKTLSRLALFQDTSYHARFRERFPYVSIGPVLDAIEGAERAFVLETHGEGEDEERLVDMVRANRLRGFGASLTAGNVARLAAALPGARALASLDLRQSALDEVGLEALATALPQSSLRALSFTRHFGVFDLSKEALETFCAALARTNLEELVAPSPRRELLALGAKMPTLRRFDVRSEQDK